MVKNLPANAEDMDSIPGSGRSPEEGNGYPLTPVFLPGKSHGQRSPAGYNTVHGVAKSWTRLSDFKQQKQGKWCMASAYILRGTSSSANPTLWPMVS